jgi:hypothetical protein
MPWRYMGTSWRWVVSFTLWPPELLNKRLGGPQNRFERRGKEKNLALPGLELNSSAVQPVASRYALSRILFEYL